MPERILVLAAERGDAELCRRFLNDAGLLHEVCLDADALRAALARPVDVLVIAAEWLRRDAGACVRAYISEQPEWSALPVIVLAEPHAGQGLSGLDDLEAYGNVTMLERPLRMAAFIGTLRLALQERRQQYRIRDLQAERIAAIRERNALSAMLGHELRNQLAAILISADVLERVPADSAQAAYCRDTLVTQARQMKRLLDDLSDMSRIERCKLSLQPKPIDLRQLISEAIDQVHHGFQARDQRLELALNGPPVQVLADPERLSQVFENLMLNANRYSPEGAHIRVQLDTGDGLARVSVRDEDAGLSAEALQHIFEPFYKDQSTGSRRAGLGIGLTLARSLVQMHGGSIAAHSNGPGCGSEFVVTLPLYDAEGSSAVSTAEPPE
ncbi:HAMP domain-containing sensor histidine kinase [Thiohalocapsa sp.]|uniref:sensor histidine kinase n=1 Tax=Thiohalocapsa sp. TaxID=2497641 RepID=UPI0025FEEC2E|nr:HAMP domain-containing sensor histidine kinase [Thiohalocapsa sp.]